MHRLNDKIDKADASTVVAILEDVMPIESAVVGPAVLKRLAQGQKFESTESGHHMDAAMAIGLVAAGATLTHYTWVLGEQAVKKLKNQTEISIKTQVLHDVELKAKEVDALRKALAENPGLVEEIYDALDKLSEFRERIRRSTGIPRDD